MNKLIRLTVTPKSGKNTITQREDGGYEVHLKAKPERNQANNVLIEALAEYFEVPAENFKIITGHHSPNKLIEMKSKS
jgi:uncharacterized protein YggU (UPF0235/DUF167 family)